MSKFTPLKKPLSDKAEASYTLPANYYIDPEIYEIEKKKIFYTTWQYVAQAAMLPDKGDYICLDICDESIFVIRSSDDQLRAFYNVCAHRAHQLLQGYGNVRKLIVCPYHAWSYNDKGNLMNARFSENREDFDKTLFCLREVRMETLCGLIFVNLDDNCLPLATFAKGLEEDMRKHLPYLDDLKYCGDDMLGETLMQAGWKVVVDNFVECYHCRSAHKAFASLIKMDSYESEISGTWSRQYGAEIKVENTAYEVYPDYGYQHSIFWYLWPNTTLNVLPGSDELHVFSVRPVDTLSSTFGGHSFSTDGHVYQPRADYAMDTLAPEDIHLCESVQRGLKSKSYTQGAFMVNPNMPGESEYALHHFHRMVQAALHED
jgi:phenylpropionate dioxygenase-like ring-hydroxylating dioxygenase large terminal subunit